MDELYRWYVNERVPSVISEQTIAFVDMITRRSRKVQSASFVSIGLGASSRPRGGFHNLVRRCQSGCRTDG